MGPEFVNIYIENLVKEMGELLKTKILLQTQLDMQQRISASLEQKILELETQLAEKPTKKSQKNKETDTF